MTRDLRKELEQADGTHPPTLQLKPGDVFVGVVDRYEEGPTRYGPAPIVVVIDETSGELRSLWILHHVLRDEFAKQRPRPGERIGVKRLADSDRGYQRFVLRVDRQEPADAVPDFAAYGITDGGEAPGPRAPQAPQGPPVASVPGSLANRPPGFTTNAPHRTATPELLEQELRRAGARSVADAKSILCEVLALEKFTTPDGLLDFSTLSPAELQHALAHAEAKARAREARAARQPPALGRAPAAADDEIPF